MNEPERAAVHAPPELHASATEQLRAWPAPDAAQQRLQSDFLAYLDSHPDAMQRSSSPAHLTASAFVLDSARGRLALVLHRKVGRWLQPGGHCEPGDATLLAAARREATEETGLAGLTALDTTPVDLDRHPAPCHPNTGDWHYDVRYVFIAPPRVDLVANAESLDVAWFQLDQLPDPGDESLRRVARLIRRMT